MTEYDEFEKFHKPNNVKLRKNFLKYILSDFDNFHEQKINELIDWLFYGKYGHDPYVEFYGDYLIFKDNNYIESKINLFLNSLKNTNSVINSCEINNISFNKLNIWLELGKNDEKPFNILYDKFKSLSNSQIEEKINIFLESFNGFNENQACNDSGISEIQLASWLRLRNLGGEFERLYDQYLRILTENDYNTIFDFYNNNCFSKNCLDMLFLFSDMGETKYPEIFEDYNLIYPNNDSENKIKYPESYVEKLLDSTNDFHEVDSVKLLKSKSLNNYDLEYLFNSDKLNQKFYQKKNIDKFLNFVALGYDDVESAKLANCDYKFINNWLSGEIYKPDHDTFIDDYNSALIFNDYLELINNKIDCFKYYLNDGKSLEEISNALILQLKDIELYLNLGYLNYEPYLIFYEEFKKNKFYNDNNINMFLKEIEKGKFKHQVINKSVNLEIIDEFIEKGEDCSKLHELFFTDYKISLIKNYTINKNSKVKIFLEQIRKTQSDEDASEISEIPFDVIKFWLSLNFLHEFKMDYYKSKDPKFFLSENIDAREKFLNNISNDIDKHTLCGTLSISENDIDEWLDKGKLKKEPYVEFYKEYLISTDSPYNSQLHRSFLDNISKGFTDEKSAEKINIPLDNINYWLDLGADDFEPYTDFYQKYLDIKTNKNLKILKITEEYGNYSNDENIKIRNMFLRNIKRGYSKKDALEDRYYFEKVKSWLNLGSKGIRPYNEFYNNYIEQQTNYIYKEFKLTKFLNNLKAGYSKNESLKRSKLSNGDLEYLYSKGKAHEDGYYNFYKEYNAVLKKIFNEEEAIKREKFIEEYSKGLSFDDSLKISNLPEEYVIQCFSLKDETPYFKSFYSHYLNAENEGYYFRMISEKNKFFKLIQKGKTIDDACKTADLNPNKVKTWITSGKHNNNEFTEFYDNYLQASIKYFNLKKIVDKRNIFLNFIRMGENNKDACKKSKLDIKFINKWFSFGEENIHPFTEFKQEYDIAIIDFFYSKEFIEKQNIFLNCIENGETQTNASKNAGFNPYMVSSWINKGKKGIEPYSKFYEQYQNILINQLTVNKYKIEEFFNLILNGESNIKACEISGLNIKMVNQWISKGRNGNELYLEFFERYDEIKHGNKN